MFVSPDNTTIFKRKYRWTFEADFPGGRLVPHFCKISERPTLQIVEKENSDGSYRIEKHAWAPLVTTFFDAQPDDLKDLYSLLAKFYDFGALLFKEDDPSEKLEQIKDSLGVGKIIMYDGCGNPLEEWEMRGLWPHSVNFGDLCYSSSSEIDIEITWRFKECSYKNLMIEQNT